MSELEKRNYQEVGDIVRAIQAGDAARFNDLYEKTKKMVWFEVKSAGVPDRMVEDQVQEVYLKVFRFVPTIQDPLSSWKWIKITAFQTGVDCVRKSAVRHESLVDEDGEEIFESEGNLNAPLPLPEDVMQNAESQRLVRQILKSLPDIQYRMVVAYYYNESSVREIASQFGVPEGTVKTNLSRARKSIKDKVESMEKKQGIRLHSLLPLPLFLLLFNEDVSAAIVPSSVDTAVNTMVANSLSASGTAAGASGVSGAASAAAGAAGLSTAAKTGIIVAIIAGCAAIGGAAFGIHQYQKLQIAVEQAKVEEEDHAYIEASAADSDTETEKVTEIGTETETEIETESETETETETETESEDATEPEGIDTEALELYRDVLMNPKNYGLEGQLEELYDIYVSFYDVNHDGIAEMFADCEGITADSFTAMFTVADGVVKRVENDNTIKEETIGFVISGGELMSTPWISEDGFMKSEFVHMGLTGCIHSFNGTTMHCEHNYFIDDYSGDVTLDGELISQSKWDDVLASYGTFTLIEGTFLSELDPASVEMTSLLG